MSKPTPHDHGKHDKPAHPKPVHSATEGDDPKVTEGQSRITARDELETREPPPVPHAKPPAPDGNTVVIKGNAFTPKEVLVKVNVVVTWKNEDAGPHTVTFNAITPGLGRTIPGTHEMKPGETYTASFPACGDYTYHCDHVPGMTGCVCVSD